MKRRLDVLYLLSVVLAAAGFYFVLTRELVTNIWLVLALIATLQPTIYYVLWHIRKRYS